MLLYLIDATAIWTLSLLVYHAALRNETFHSYNRLFLLFTLLLGLTLPLLSAPGITRIYAAPLQAPVIQVIDHQLPVAVPGQIPAPGIPWLILIYSAGLLFMLLTLIREAVQLVRLYRHGKRYRSDGWIIIETGQAHGPFSFLRLLFVSRRAGYSKVQWRAILDHERQHARLGHGADLLLMQLLRILLWFHPLVHYYRRQILLVHEYEADAGVELPLPEYGHFLVEQALLQGAPSIAHSFNHSPIKNRILMLNRSTTAQQRVRLLLALPLTLVCICCFMKISYAQQAVWKGNVLEYQGNKIEMKITDPPFRSVMVRSNAGGGADKSVGLKKGEPISVTILADTIPVRLNGQAIYSSGEVSTEPQLAGNMGAADAYLFAQLKPLLDRLPEGRQWLLEIRDILIDENGKVVYFRFHGAFNTYKLNEPVPPQKATPDQRKEIEDRVYSLLYNGFSFKPAIKDGKAVAFRLEVMNPIRFAVSNGAATLNE